MFTGHQHRIHALELLLLSMHTRDPVFRARFERLSELWLGLAQRRERIDHGEEVRSHGPPAPLGAWKQMSTAPRQEEVRVLTTAWGPRIWLRDGDRTARARWRAEGPPDDTPLADKSSSRDAGWEDLDGEPLAFAPKEWRELDD